MRTLAPTHTMPACSTALEQKRRPGASVACGWRFGGEGFRGWRGEVDVGVRKMLERRRGGEGEHQEGERHGVADFLCKLLYAYKVKGVKYERHTLGSDSVLLSSMPSRMATGTPEMGDGPVSPWEAMMAAPPGIQGPGFEGDVRVQRVSQLVSPWEAMMAAPPDIWGSGFEGRFRSSMFRGV